MCFVDQSTGAVSCDFDSVCSGGGVQANAYSYDKIRFVSGQCSGGKSFCCQYDEAAWGMVESLSLAGTDQVDQIELFLEYQGNRHDLLANGDGTRLTVTVNGRDSGDTLRGSNEMDPTYMETLDGQGGGDTLEGGSGDDRLHGGGGIDTLRGGDGADTLFGGSESDYVYGDAGTDTLYGQRGDDWLYGGEDADVLRGGKDSDFCYGDGGDDVIYGGTENDELNGGPGNDDLIGGDGIDDLRAGNDLASAINRLHGGPGDDQLFGGPGTDTLYGGAGVDVLMGGDELATTTTFFCENGMATSTTTLASTDVQQFSGSSVVYDTLEYQRGDVGAQVAPYFYGTVPQTIDIIYVDHHIGNTTGATDFSPIWEANVSPLAGVHPFQAVPECTQIRADYGEY